MGFFEKVSLRGWIRGNRNFDVTKDDRRTGHQKAFSGSRDLARSASEIEDIGVLPIGQWRQSNDFRNRAAASESKNGPESKIGDLVFVAIDKGEEASRRGLEHNNGAIHDADAAKNFLRLPNYRKLVDGLAAERLVLVSEHDRDLGDSCTQSRNQNRFVPKPTVELSEIEDFQVCDLVVASNDVLLIAGIRSSDVSAREGSGKPSPILKMNGSRAAQIGLGPTKGGVGVRNAVRGDRLRDLGWGVRGVNP
jgi:hypothetical protein